ncbi:MAG: PKD domain-containing protein, partial [Planctomycetota bacterium]
MMKAKVFCAVIVSATALLTGRQVDACPPTAILVAEPNYVVPGKSVILDASDSTDTSPGYIKKYEWDFTDNNSYDYTETSISYPDGAFDGKTTHIYESTGTYTAKVRVTDNDNLTDAATYTVNVSEDSDDDGLPSAWETLYGLSDSNCADADEDLDNDGYNNLCEYLHVSDPNDDTKMPDANYTITVYVPSDVNSIQRAINASIDGDTVIVYPGTYYELIDFSGKAIAVMSTDPNDWTVIALTKNDVNDPDEYVVTFTNSEDVNSVLKGVVLTGGDLGIYCDGASPTISNCVIAGNGSGLNEGAGLYDCNGSCPTVTNCFFSENDANNGGGICNIDSSPAITNCVFGKNVASIDGGAIYDCNSSPTLINCTFSGNFAGGDGGGIYNDSTSFPTITNCIFWGNDANGPGCEVYNDGSADPNFSYCDIKGCGGSGAWDANFGTNGGGNIDSDVNFVDADNPMGPDSIFGTIDDGLQVRITSSCIDAADGDKAPSADIMGRARIDVNGVDNTGAGDPNYADIGAYETPRVWFVDKDANGANNGTSWADAFTDLQGGLADANSGEEIWVAE